VVTVKLLVAYGSKHGSTREVAEAIAGTLEKAAHEVVLRRAADIEDLTPYDGVVLGGSLYLGRWHSDAARFLSKPPAGALRAATGRLRAWAQDGRAG
jgi:menaquinone-dependent protoporphyrinogen oxidase